MTYPDWFKTLVSGTNISPEDVKAIDKGFGKLQSDILKSGDKKTIKIKPAK